MSSTGSEVKSIMIMGLGDVTSIDSLYLTKFARDRLGLVLFLLGISVISFPQLTGDDHRQWDKTAYKGVYLLHCYLTSVFIPSLKFYQEDIVRRIDSPNVYGIVLVRMCSLDSPQCSSHL